MKLESNICRASHYFWLFFILHAGHGVPLQADIAVGDMMKKDQERFPERREELLNLLGVDPNWRMHQVNSRPHQTAGLETNRVV